LSQHLNGSGGGTPKLGKHQTDLPPRWSGLELFENKSVYDDDIDRFSNSQYEEPNNRGFRNVGKSQGAHSYTDLNRSNASSKEENEPWKRDISSRNIGSGDAIPALETGVSRWGRKLGGGGNDTSMMSSGGVDRLPLKKV